MTDLDELLERLGWVRSEIGRLRVELEEWIDKAIILGSRQDPDQPFLMQLLAHQKLPLPISCRARSGTIANELRSLLDGLASALAIRNGNNPSGVYFPISKKEEDFNNDIRLKNKIKKLSVADQEKIMAARPFSESLDGEPGNFLLYGLHQADVKRKHHRLVVNNVDSSVGVRSGAVGLMISAPKALTNRPQIMAWISCESTAEINFRPIFEYAEPDVLVGKSVVPTLMDFANLVESIILQFR